MPQDDRSLADRFDRYLDELVDGHQAAMLDVSSLGETARRVHALRRLPSPDADFVNRLEEELMETAHQRVVGSSPLPAMPGERKSAQWWHPSFVSRDSRPRRRNAPGLIATALLLAITLVAGYGTAQLLPNRAGENHPAMIPAIAGTPATPAKSACPLPVRSTSPLVNSEGTPIPPTTKTILPLPKPPEPLGFVTAKQPFPDGTPADPETIVAITAAVQEWKACMAVPRGSINAVPATFAMFSDDYFRRTPKGLNPEETQQSEARLSAAWWHAYVPWGFSKDVSPAISDVRQLPDGRVGMILNVETEYPYVVVCVHHNNHWLIDELALYAPGGTPVAGQLPLPPAATPTATHEITIEMADIVFRPSTVAIPANVPVTITLVNQGKLRHSFVIDALHVRIELAPGARGQVVLDIPPGTYEFYCEIPGHKAAGMIGHLQVATFGTPVPTP